MNCQSRHNADGRCNVPDLQERVTYTQVSAGPPTVLLMNDGHVVACGLNDEDQCNIPDLPEGETYIQVSARHSHTVLLKSDGHVVACGDTAYGKCNIPNLPKGATYKISKND